ncbi:MAG: DUF4124 domain-containing protein [Proteobacteria bacterium]|nr:DUF4124 domain-containing protein [Pseudomonadota bacterium]MCL2307826.1 DUF4124 domain-containing protein [Pseudomonadota bacterium]
MNEVFISLLKSSARVAAGGVLALCAGHALAEICVYENNAGQTLYTNVSPGADWKKRQCFATVEPPTPPAAKGAAATPAARSALPKVSAEKQKERDAMRRKVIENELAAESKLLEEARTAYANGAPPALPDEFLNPQKYAARIAQLRESVSLHERNVEALKKEIARM